MRLRFLARFWRTSAPRSARHGGFAVSAGDGFGPAGPPPPPAPVAAPSAAATTPLAPSGGRHRRNAAGPAGQADAGQTADGRRAEPPAPFGSPARQSRGRPHPEPAAPGRSGDAGGAAAVRRPRSGGADRAALRRRPRTAAAPRGTGSPAAPGETVRAAAARAGADRAVAADRLPWYEVAHARRVAEGRQDCGRLEEVLIREWPEDRAPPPEAAQAVRRLADLPPAVKDSLAAGLDAIHVGPGGVPDLDDMSQLRGVPLPSGRATWDACAGAYGGRKIIVGTQPSAAPDVMCHEVGHALDDIDAQDGGWQSDEDDFRSLYDRCRPWLVSEFHRQEGELGRREFFADSFAAIASHQRPALVDMLGGDTRSALEVMLYFNLRYGI